MKFLSFLGYLLIGLGSVLSAETYHSVRVSELDFGELSESAKKAMKISPAFGWLDPVLNVRSTAECYAGSTEQDGQNRNQLTQGGVEIVFKLADENPVSGFVDMRETGAYGSGASLTGFGFTFIPGEETKSTKERFETIRSNHVRKLAMAHKPGAAWFRYLAGPEENPNNRRQSPSSDLSESFAIFSGGRAISENLALDRELILAEDKEGKIVPLSEITGVTVEAIDWSSRLPEGEVKVDALSLSIPENQHALFAKSLPDLLALMDRAETEIIPSAQSYSVRNPFRQLASRYKKQMGLDVANVAARLLPAKSVAVTGGDPYFPMGSDVAILMETDSPELLFKALVKVIEVKASAVGATATKLPGNGFGYSGFETEDRLFSSHIWRMGNVVAVSNSPMQIQRLTAVAKEKESALGTTDEFRFFRNRYPLDAEETAFIFLSDAAIRRWAGPELRIAASRRTRAFAAIGELTSQALAGQEVSKEYAPLLGETVWTDGRMISEKYGALDFMKPASELAIETATLPEKDAYERWRRGYERGWSQVFDPIAIRVLSKKGEIGFDLSVIPLTVDSDFKEFVEVCGKAELEQMARWVPEESVFHAALAVDTKGERFKRYGNMMVDLLPGLSVNPLSWMSGSVSVDLEKSLFWEANMDGDFDHFTKMPVLVRIGSKSRLKLALFMTAVKTAVQTAAPGSLEWSTRESDGEVYAVIEGKEDEIGADARIYYATLPNALLVSLREEVLLRAIRREKHELTEEEAAKLPAPTQMMLDSSPVFLASLENSFRANDPLQRLREESWEALPILNEWHRMFPDKDPVAVQMVHYSEDIFCPGGKGFRWNDDKLTMESVAFGFPAEPRSDPADLPSIMNYKNLSTALKFEDDGLRAGLKLGGSPSRIPTSGAKKLEPVVLATAADLTPLKEGVTLKYTGRSYGSDLTMDTTVENVVEKEGKTTFEERCEWIENAQDSYLYTTQYILDGDLLEKSGSGDGDSTVYDQPVLAIPAQLIAGAVTSTRSSGIGRWKPDEGEVEEAKFRSKLQIRVVGKEDIEVPAGKFEGCIKMETVSEFLDGGDFSHSKYVKWFHPGTGLVKSEAVEGAEDYIVLEKIIQPEAGE